MKGCINCGSYDRGEYGKPGRCVLGNDEAFRQWWIENGDKRGTDKIENMDCFTPTAVSRLLDGVLVILDEMETVIDSHKKGGKVKYISSKLPKETYFVGGNSPEKAFRFELTNEAARKIMSYLQTMIKLDESGDGFILEIEAETCEGKK